jgi:hypothetical protein
MAHQASRLAIRRVSPVEFETLLVHECVEPVGELRSPIVNVEDGGAWLAQLSIGGCPVVNKLSSGAAQIQDKIDTLSRRGQGQPKNEEIDEVISRMRGRFKLDGSVITFRELMFGVTGADVDLEEALLQCGHAGETGGGGRLPLALTARVDDQSFSDAP